MLECLLRGGDARSARRIVLRVSGALPKLVERLQRYYPNYPLVANDTFADAYVGLRRSFSLDRDWYRTAAVFGDDGRLFTKFPLDAMVANIEWMTNWFVAMRVHHFLMFHAAVVADDFQNAVIFPGEPGAGKSTLCAYLIHHGWRLLSDEFTLIRDRSLEIHPFPRAIPLKNESIGVIREILPKAVLGPEIFGTRKGTISHLCPEDTHIRRMDETARPKLVVFPSFKSHAPLSIESVAPKECFAGLTRHSFNYVIRGLDGFEPTSALTNAVKWYRLIYSDLPSAAAAIKKLMEETREASISLN
ncbi:MAG: HprK-related kinase A [Gammaproteobacteria bacterium]|nr:HprK-related kinase A [Gammaproteobacteria bacterium]